MVISAGIMLIMYYSARPTPMILNACKSLLDQNEEQCPDIQLREENENSITTALTFMAFNGSNGTEITRVGLINSNSVIQRAVAMAFW